MTAYEPNLSQPPLRIALYGYAERDAGSISSAGYVILRELLERGHQIDFFGKRSFAFPVGLDSYPSFRFIDAEGRVERSLGKALLRANRLTRPFVKTLLADQSRRNIPQAIRAEHKKRAYDLCFYFGIWAFDRIEGLPTISWVQGAPGSDGRSIRRHAAQLRRLEGPFRYGALRGYAVYRETIGRPPFSNSDVAICGSKWSIESLKGHVKSEMLIESLPYPVDLNAFTSVGRPSTTRPLILWAGRSVPRKRLDLFLDACAKLLDDGRDIDIRVIGGFSFAPGYQRLIDEFRYPQRLHYSPTVPRQQMPEIYRQATVLLQPSEDEDFGSGIAEALACGTPVVLGPTNGTCDYVGEAGFKFSNYDAASVASAVAAALDASGSDPMAVASLCRQTAERFFDVRSIVTQLEHLLRASANQKIHSVTVARENDLRAASDTSSHESRVTA